MDVFLLMTKDISTVESCKISLIPHFTLTDQRGLTDLFTSFLFYSSPEV